MSKGERLITDSSIESGPWRRDHIWVSHYNFLPELESNRFRPPEVVIHDLARPQTIA